MRHPFPIRRRGLLVTVLVAALAFSAGAAVAVYADQNATVYYACVKTNGGDLRLVGENEACKGNETKISWNQQGPAGPAGPQGAQGPAGGAGGGPTGTIIGDIGVANSPTAPVTPVAGVTVYISGTAAITTTDSAGHFVLRDVPLGVWSVTAATDSAGEFGAQHCESAIAHAQLTQAGQVAEIPYIARGPNVCQGTRQR